MKSRTASMKIKSKVHNEYVLPVMVYGSATWALNKAHMRRAVLALGQRDGPPYQPGSILNQNQNQNNLYPTHVVVVQTKYDRTV